MGFHYLQLGTFEDLSSVATLTSSQVSENGLTGSIMTFYELTEGDMAHTTGASFQSR